MQVRICMKKHVPRRRMGALLTAFVLLASLFPASAVPAQAAEGDSYYLMNIP